MPSLMKNSFPFDHQNIIGLIKQNIGKYRERQKVYEFIGIKGPLDSASRTETFTPTYACMTMTEQSVQWIGEIKMLNERATYANKNFSNILSTSTILCH